MAVKRRTASGQNAVLSTVEWLGTLFVLIVPIVGIVLYFVWAFGSGNIHRRNFCRAALIMTAISIVLGLISSLVMGGFTRMAIRGFGAF
jgi:hypothetical protein